MDTLGIRLHRSLVRLLLVGLLLAAGAAEARIATVQWRDSNPAPSPVTGFRLYVGLSSGAYGASVDMGLPVSAPDGTFSSTVTVPDGVPVFLTMTAYEITGAESVWSNEQVLQPLPTNPPPPPVDQLPDGVITNPAAATVTINAGQSVFFTANGGDPDGGTVTHLWDFDTVASGVPNAFTDDPGTIVFPNPGTFVVTFTVTDDEGNPDPTPPSRTIIVLANTPNPPPPPPTPPPTGDFSGLRNAGRAATDAVTLTAPAGDPRLFVAEASGAIRIVEGGLPRPGLFLDVSDDVSGEGLLGLAFDPDYANNGYLFLHRVDRAGDVVISRFSRGAHPYVADRASEVELLRVPLAFRGNPGGGLVFGHDGFLFVGVGDGGNVGDPWNRAQNPGQLSGKILRLDVGQPAMASSIPAGAYAIPADNPYVGNGSARAEVWAIGLRNPHHLSVDRQTGGLWIADQGSGLREELNYEDGSDPGGHNYGWDVMEGTACNNTDPAPSVACNDPVITPPVFDYPAAGQGCSVIGGQPYRGSQPALAGEYFFADGCTGRVWTYDMGSGALTSRTEQFSADGHAGVVAVGFGEGGTGELYVLSWDGNIFEVQSAMPSCSDGVDNDGDGLVDFPLDPGCRDANADAEAPLCDDGLDNDLDGDVDMADSNCTAPYSVEAEPFQLGQLDSDEVFCGLGAELVLLFPMFMWLRGGGRRVLRAVRRA